ncbi:MAG: hypothetical protein HY794_04390, partial [Desulfarculus sp.]|nr:hypothetical protein [Desulfarculus sp.]
AGAEEPASAAEELDSQAHHLQDMVGDLLNLVGGAHKAGRRQRSSALQTLPAPAHLE